LDGWHRARVKTHLLITAFLAAAAPAPGQGGAGEPAGQWKAPANDGRSWKHGGTGLAFPQLLGTSRLAGEFEYKDGGTFIRYENLDERSRADIFLFKTGAPLPALEDRHRRILSEMDNVVSDMEAMVRQGRYKNLDAGALQGGELELWQQQSLPIATRQFTATRLGISKEGSAEAVIKIWVGITIVADHILTIRHMRPADTGEAGEQSMKTFAGLVFQIIKDPSLRGHIRELLAAYLKNPLSDDGEQAAAAVLAYLEQAPWFPINIPEDPVSGWMEKFEKSAPGTQDHLLRAFMLGAAKAAFEDADALACLNAGARQFAVIYRELARQHPQITLPEVDSFAAAAEKDLGAAWLKDHAHPAR